MMLMKLFTLNRVLADYWVGKRTVFTLRVMCESDTVKLKTVIKVYSLSVGY